MEDKKFIEALCKGTNGAYGLLLDRYQQKVFNTCISFVPNKEDAEDLAQDVFVEVFRSISKFKGNSKLSTWIYRISVNKCLEFIRKKNTKKRLGFTQSLLGNKISIDRTSYFVEFNHPGIQLENKEKTEILYTAINRLPETQRVVYTLHKIDDLSHKEVAEITKKSISSIESLLFRAKNNLQGLLHDYYKKDRS